VQHHRGSQQKKALGHSALVYALLMFLPPWGRRVIRRMWTSSVYKGSGVFGTGQVNLELPD